MLRIEIPSGGSAELTFSKLERLNIPTPENGFDSEVNDNVVMSFENEQDALDYSLEMDRYANSLSDHASAEYRAASQIIRAINEDEFVQAYTRR
jgi:hypothetical protein